MNTFRFHRDLDVEYLQSHYGNDPFSAREVLGSFVEMAEHELEILESAREQRKFSAFARIVNRLKNGLEAVGLNEEKERIDTIRSRYALAGADEDFQRQANDLLDSVRSKSNLLRIEVERLDEHIELSAR